MGVLLTRDASGPFFFFQNGPFHAFEQTESDTRQAASLINQTLIQQALIIDWCVPQASSAFISEATDTFVKHCPSFHRLNLNVTFSRLGTT